jgi:integrase
LLPACGDHLRVLVDAALETGCRRGELLALQWHQIQFEPRPELWLPAGKTKTGRARRVPISTRLRAILEMRLDAYRATAGPD